MQKVIKCNLKINSHTPLLYTIEAIFSLDCSYAFCSFFLCKNFYVHMEVNIEKQHKSRCINFQFFIGILNISTVYHLTLKSMSAHSNHKC